MKTNIEKIKEILLKRDKLLQEFFEVDDLDFKYLGVLRIEFPNEWKTFYTTYRKSINFIRNLNELKGRYMNEKIKAGDDAINYEFGTLVQTHINAPIFEFYYCDFVHFDRDYLGQYNIILV